MTLGDMSNMMLAQGQQPGANFVIGGGGSPNWSALNNPQFSQGYIEFCINQGNLYAMGDLEELEIALVSFTLTSTQNTFKYAIPPSGYAPISHVAHVYYQPRGLPYIWDFRNGTQFVSWMEFQKKTGQGYLAPYTFANQPGYATIDPTLKFLYFYPGSAIAGDTITVQYQPLPLEGATGSPTLVAETDTPLLPLDCHMAIFFYAMGMFWIRAREMQAAAFFYNESLQSPGLYQREIVKIKNKYTKKHHGDTIRVEPFPDNLSMSKFSI